MCASKLVSCKACVGQSIFLWPPATTRQLVVEYTVVFELHFFAAIQRWTFIFRVIVWVSVYKLMICKFSSGFSAIEQNVLPIHKTLFGVGGALKKEEDLFTHNILMSKQWFWFSRMPMLPSIFHILKSWTATLTEIRHLQCFSCNICGFLDESSWCSGRNLWLSAMSRKVN